MADESGGEDQGPMGARDVPQANIRIRVHRYLKQLAPHIRGREGARLLIELAAELYRIEEERSLARVEAFRAGFQHGPLNEIIASLREALAQVTKERDEARGREGCVSFTNGNWTPLGEHIVRLEKERDEARSALAQAQTERDEARAHARIHKPSLQRIKEAHTQMSLDAMSSGDTYGHRVYAQGDDQCYLCALVVLVEEAQTDALEKAVKIALTTPRRDEHIGEDLPYQLRLLSPGALYAYVYARASNIMASDIANAIRQAMQDTGT